MTDHRKRKRKTSRAGPSSRRLTVRRVPEEGVFELVYPRCVEARAEDMEEVRAMVEAGEIDVAVDELRWLLGGCRQLLEAHKLLGEIAFSEDDLPLARGHFGRAYELGLKALPETGLPGLLPYTRRANRAFFEAGKGLVQCLRRLSKSRMAAKVVEQLLALDPSDPLGLKELRA